MKCDFSGYATRNDLRCADGRTIRRNAFKGQDGAKVPLVWNHQHNSPNNVIGHAILENRNDGVYAYCMLNDTENGKTVKELLHHGDVRALSIFANNLAEKAGNVFHGIIRELSVVLAGANPGAYVDTVLAHGADGDEISGLEACYWEPVMLYHSDDAVDTIEEKVKEDETVTDNTVIQHADSEDKTNESDKTVQDVIDTMNEEQQKVLYGIVGSILEKDSQEDDEVKHNAFDNEYEENMVDGELTHSDEEAIIELAKRTGVGSLHDAMAMYTEETGATLAHGINNIETLFPEYHNIPSGAPEKIERDHSWVSVVLNGVQKSPMPRIRTRQADVRGNDIRSFGYKKGDKKDRIGNVQLLSRTTDPQTVYVTDELNRDDILDIQDFEPVGWLRGIMRSTLEEEIARAILIGDGRDEGDQYKIHETHIRSILNDDELYTIHGDLDLAQAKAKLNGTNTSANFSDEYIYAEAILQSSLYLRENYKGNGTPAMFCTPHLLNQMLLARDLNGRRIYNSVTDLAAALNVSAIHTVEQFQGVQRTTKEGKKKNLLAIFVNLSNYQVGSVKGGEITNFDDFDIDFNKYKYLMETRLSGASIRIKSAVVLEEPATEESHG